MEVLETFFPKKVSKYLLFLFPSLFIGVSEVAKVYFVSAGAGDLGLITVRGQGLLESSGVVIYAGSLVNPLLMQDISAEVYDSAGMTLDEIIEVMKSAINEGKDVVRLHTGDTAFYSAISEQIRRLKDIGIAYEVIPGISAAQAGFALLGYDFSVPIKESAVIYTRLEGRTPVPEKEKLGDLSKHSAVMAVFLSAGMIEKVAAELINGYNKDTPVCVIQKVSWDDEKVVYGTVNDIADKVKAANITKTAIILVGVGSGR
ncbi:precorrin-4 C11-methyltransferase [Candidatus Magnetoovum chiemensis]|nr:precorrin-4 C11-methyltransferase [Candidatus Magnetoovum chiemensis]